MSFNFDDSKAWLTMLQLTNELKGLHSVTEVRWLGERLDSALQNLRTQMEKVDTCKAKR